MQFYHKSSWLKYLLKLINFIYKKFEGLPLGNHPFNKKVTNASEMVWKQLSTLNLPLTVLLKIFEGAR